MLIIQCAAIIRSLNVDGTEKASLEIDDLLSIIAVENGCIYYHSNWIQFFEEGVEEWYEQGIIVVAVGGEHCSPLLFRYFNIKRPAFCAVDN